MPPLHALAVFIQPVLLVPVSPSSLFLGAETSLHLLIGFFRAVVPIAEPLIERHNAISAVVHFEIFVMQVVGVGVAIERRIFRDLKLVETDMPVSAP